MKIIISVLILPILLGGCLPEDQRQEERIRREVERSEQEKAREVHEQSQLGPNESSVTD